MITKMELGGIFELHLSKRFSIEAGGGVHVPVKVDPIWNAEGYTIRTGMRFYSSKSSFYVNPVFFYRYNVYHNRSYSWDKNSELSEILETRDFPTPSAASECWFEVRANEVKQVYAVQVIIGWEYLLLEKFPFELFIGIGGRYKHRELELTNYRSGNCSGGIPGNTSRIRETYDTYLPSILGGFQIGLPIIKRKY